MSVLIGLEPLPSLTVSEDLHLIATLIAIAVWLGVLVKAAGLARRHASAIPLVMVAGGAITFGYEPVVDVLGQCYLPETHQWTLFTALDRSMPLYGLFVYSAFFGGFSMMAWAHLKRGGAARGLWTIFAVAILINTFLFETPAVWADVYTYYGNQPWDLWGFPLWWPFVNTAGPIAAGALVYVLDERLRLERGYLLAATFVAVPLFDGLSNGAAGLPTWLALNSDVPTVVVWVAGTVTMLIGCLIVFVTIKALETITAPAGARGSAPRGGIDRVEGGPGVGRAGEASERDVAPAFAAVERGLGVVEQGH